jgi:hypothetical protein
MARPDEVEARLEAELEFLGAEVLRLEAREAELRQPPKPKHAAAERICAQIARLQDFMTRLERWVRNSPRDVGSRPGGGCWQGALRLPWVEFDNGRREIVLPALLASEIVGVGTSLRLQLPIKQAWALTIHKSQVSLPPAPG